MNHRTLPPKNRCELLLLSRPAPTVQDSIPAWDWARSCLLFPKTPLTVRLSPRPLLKAEAKAGMIFNFSGAWYKHGEDPLP